MDLLPTDDILTKVKNKFFVVSLPRTGTKSLCKMFLILGYRISHCPSIKLSGYFTENTVDCFADTPIYRPSLIKKLALEPSNKFLYIERDCDEWVTSFENMTLNASYMDYLTRDLTKIKPISRLDRDSLIEIFSGETYTRQLARDAFTRHREEVFNSIPTDQLLVFRFQNGWQSLCDFVGRDVPSADIPHLNKNVLFDPIA